MSATARAQKIASEHRVLAAGPDQIVCSCDRTWHPKVEYTVHIVVATAEAIALDIEAVADQHRDVANERAAARAGVRDTTADSVRLGLDHAARIARGPS